MKKMIFLMLVAATAITASSIKAGWFRRKNAQNEEIRSLEKQQDRLQSELKLTLRLLEKGMDDESRAYYEEKRDRLVKDLDEVHDQISKAAKTPLTIIK